MTDACNVYIDADACPVKDETYRVAGRHGFRVLVVSNRHLYTPAADDVELVVVGDDVDAADDWIADHAGPGDAVITSDLPLAGRCLEAGARVLDPRGEEFTAESIVDLLATRDLMNHLRDMGHETGGPKPFSERDRKRFLQRLDAVLVALLRKRPKARTTPADETTTKNADTTGGQPDPDGSG